MLVQVTSAIPHPLFITFSFIGLIVHFTRNIWAGVVQNALMGNILTNLYMLSVMPEKVFIADPGNLPEALFATIFVTVGLTGTGYLLVRAELALP